MPLTRIPVLMYHHVNPHTGDTVTVTPEVFAQQMSFLAAEGYETLSVDELMEFIAGEKSFGQKAVAITFDDGWLDNLFYAVPVLKSIKFKATFFIITARVDAASLRVRTPKAAIPDHETSKKLIQGGQADRVVLDWGLIKELTACGLFSFYSHTVTHRRCADLAADEVAFELAQSKERLEVELGRACDYLCWPYGSFSHENVQTAAETGCKGLFTTIDGHCESGSDPFMIKRIEVKNSVLWLKDRLSEESL